MDQHTERLTWVPGDGGEPVDLTPVVLKASPMTPEQLDCPCGCQDRPAPTTWSAELTFTIASDTAAYEAALRALLRGQERGWSAFHRFLAARPKPLAIDGHAYRRRQRARARRNR